MSSEDIIPIPIDFFNCCVCYKRAYNPVNSSCTHITCGGCFDKIQGEKICPICRTKLYYSINNLIEKILIDYAKDEECRNQDCEFKGTYKEVLNHMKDCLKKIITCEKCRMPMTLKYYQKEHLSLCNFRMVECERCQKKIESTDMKSHLENVCEYVEISCDQCEAKIVRAHFKLHQSINHYIIKCKGCNEHITAKNHESHTLNCLYMKITCEYCNKDGARMLYKDHLLMCPEKPTFCIHCNTLIKNKDIISHIKGCDQFKRNSIELSSTVKQTFPTTLSKICEICEVCNNRINSNFHHNICKKYYCTICGVEYTSEKCWKNHLLNDHRMIINI